jgi:hypothetical protein
LHPKVCGAIPVAWIAHARMFGIFFVLRNGHDGVLLPT